jgi:prepilin-type processing-associated H-X9-DG protein
MAWNPTTGQGGDGAIAYTSQVNGGNLVGSFTDGLSNTVGYAEVKAYTWVLKTNVVYAAAPAIPAPTAAAVLGLVVASPAPTFNTAAIPNGHTSWTEAQTFHNGVTFVLPPNTKVIYTSGGVNYDVDVHNGNEGDAARVTYCAMTSRSYHTGLVNVLLMDGSVRSVRDSVDPYTWRALGTRAGGEVVGDY